MKFDNLKWIYFGVAAVWCTLLIAVSQVPAAIIVNDSWADAGRNDGADPLDINWWSSVSNTGTGIEVSAGSLGLVTGTSGRGIHGIFPTQTLTNVGSSLVATYTFTTPATVGNNLTAAFRVGLFDTLGRAGLNADITSSSGSPNSLYGYFATNDVGLPGYMLDMDVQTPSDDFNVRQLDTPVNVALQIPTGRLMGTTTGFTSVGDGPNGAFTIAANTTYTGSLTITRISATDVQVTGKLGTASFSVNDAFDSTSFGLIAFWANSNVFGNTNAANTPNNGIDFSNITIELNEVPEPASLWMIGMAALLVVARTRRRTI
jgi:PEP-CTERM motif